MGVHLNITADKFPAQGNFLNKRVEVCFHFNTGQKVLGTVVRDDAESPGKFIIALDDCRYVLSTECQYSLAK